MHSVFYILNIGLSFIIKSIVQDFSFNYNSTVCRIDNELKLMFNRGSSKLIFAFKRTYEFVHNINGKLHGLKNDLRNRTLWISGQRMKRSNSHINKIIKILGSKKFLTK